MENSWFGLAPWGKICESMPRVDAPVTMCCSYCEERIGPEDNGQVTIVDGTPIQAVHQECLLRMVLGSLGHQQRKCSCYGGTAEDPPGMTKREAAKATVDYLYSRGRVSP
jgi:hypothetical protein